MAAPTPNPLPAGSSISLGDQRESTLNPRFLPDQDLKRTDPLFAAVKTLRDYEKRANAGTDFSEMAVVVESIATNSPQDPDNIFLAKNTSQKSFTEYIILRAPLALDDVSLSSLKDLITYLSLQQVAASSNIQVLSPGTIVRITRKNNYKGVFYISDILAQGGFSPGSGNFGSLTNSAANAFRLPPCPPPPISSGAGSVGGTPSPVAAYTAPTPSIPSAPSQPCRIIDYNAIANSGLSDGDKAKITELETEFAQEITKFILELKNAEFKPTVNNNQDYINNGYRTVRQQIETYRKLGIANIPMTSKHLSGLAVDLNMELNGVKLSKKPDGDPKKIQAWDKVGEIVKKFPKIKWGKDFEHDGGPDYVHFELNKS